jgi:predicted transposase YbfD/YdcC
MNLIEQLKQIPDPRHIKGRRHPLWLVLALSLCGFLCGYQGYRPLADFCRNHAGTIRQLLDIPETSVWPSYSTFRRSFQQVEPQFWEVVFNAWSLSTLPPLTEGLQWSVDGKSIRCTCTGGNTSRQNFISQVSIYNLQMGVLQLRLMENQQVSEIHVAQAMLQDLPELPPGQCFSFDALHTTQATVDLCNQHNLDYLIALKPNKAKSYAAVQTLVQHQPPQDTAEAFDDSHGRQITRQAQVFLPSAELQAKWPELATVGVIHRTGQRDNRAIQETVYYLSRRAWTAVDLLTATRQHWQIENGLHWVKDVAFAEDWPPRRGGHAPVNWAIFHTFCITLARRQGWRTIPQALRAWANQLHQVFHLLV